MTKLILIRHGESTYNLERRYTGQSDIPLTEKGVAQAKITAEYILKNYSIDAVYSSDLSRAVETARPVFEPLGLTVRTDPRLREIHAGIWQGMLFADVEKTYPEEYANYKKNRATARTLGGEGMADVLERTYAAIVDIAKKNDGKTVLVSLHNGPLMALQIPLFGRSFDEIKSVFNNSITELDFDGESFKVIKFGYAEHLGELLTGFRSTTHN